MNIGNGMFYDFDPIYLASFQVEYAMSRFPQFGANYGSIPLGSEI
jgi:hypothetical protein